jgi:hypothetical protein
MRKNIFAYTGATGAGYPPYVSINLLESGDVEVTVRGAAVHVEQTDELPAHLREGPTVCAVVPADEWPLRTPVPW